MAKIIPIISTGFDSNVYLIKDKKNALIDSGTGKSERIKKEILKHADRVDMIINTHAHFDHAGGNAFFKKAFGPKILIHEKDAEEIRNQEFYGTVDFFSLGVEKEPYGVDTTVKEGDILNLGEVKLKVLHTPGHTPGSTCLRLKIENKIYLLSGDTLFLEGAVGRTDLSGGSFKELKASLERLKNTDFDFLLPGHMDMAENGKEHAEMAWQLLKELEDEI